MHEICLSSSTSGMWKRSHGSSIETPPIERGGNSREEPNTTAPHLDSTHSPFPRLESATFAAPGCEPIPVRFFGLAVRKPRN
jgi:hypothetical protein